MSKPLFERINLQLGCNAQYDKSGTGIIPDTDMYLFFEKGTRGAFSYIYNRYSKTNNKYEPKQESERSIYLDARNLHGYAVSKFLLTSGFKWIDPKGFDCDKQTSNSSKGCGLEVDLEYHKE